MVFVGCGSKAKKHYLFIGMARPSKEKDLKKVFGGVHWGTGVFTQKNLMVVV